MSPDSSDVRTGLGFDTHRFGGEGPILLAGVAVDSSFGVVATSDGDVPTHAVIDALLGAANLGDLGEHFPSSDARWHGADSLELLRMAVRMAGDAGFRPTFVDVTVIAESVRVGPHRASMRANLAEALGLDVGSVSIKATTTDGLGFLGGGEGIAAMAVVTVRRRT